MGKRVAHFRTRGRQLTAQALADRTSELGYPIDRSVIAKLEKGHRQSVTAAELFVLAQALNVSPVLLILPLGHEQTIDVAPDTTVTTTEALLWIAGQQALPGDEQRGYQFELETVHIVALFQLHKTRVDQWRNSRMAARQIRAGERKGTDVDVEEFDRRAEQAVTHLRGMRRQMEVEGLLPPRIDDDLALALKAQP